MREAIFFALLGYLAGSVLFARAAAGLFGKPDILAASRDHNPGAANAFQYGGFRCGVFVLAGDLAKGFLPVWLYGRWAAPSPGPLWIGLVLAAPVVGHAFPLYYHFQGGKGIAVTFGCLLGLFPCWEPAVALAFFFLFFSLVLRVDPHFYRTIAAYLAAGLCLVLRGCAPGVLVGFGLMAAVVLLRLHLSAEERTGPEVKLFWTR